MLVRMDGLLAQARQAGTYVPAYNVYNLETVQAGMEASLRGKRPVILAFGEKYQENASLKVIAAIVKCLAQEHPYDVALHLDHCEHLACIAQALDVGFTSVMYDGSSLPLGENIDGTKQARALADAAGASLEGELGGLNDESGRGGVCVFTDLDSAQRYVRETGVDCLAVSVGNAHGQYKGEPHIDLELLGQIGQRVRVPLVLHGCSGIPLQVIAQAAKAGVAKINVNTDITMAGAAALKAALEQEKRMEGPVRVARNAMVETMLEYLC